MKRILRYRKGTPTLGLYYPKCLGFDLKGYSDSDYAGCNIDLKSTSGACQIPGGKLDYLRELWSTAVSYDPFLSIYETEKCPLREFLIKFSVLNGQRPLTLDFNTFCSLNGIDYKNGKYVAHPTPEVVKKELGKIVINAIYLDKTPIQENSFPVAWRILFTFVIKDVKFGLLHDILSNSNFRKDHSNVTNIELTAHMIDVNNQKGSASPLPFSKKTKKVKSQTMNPTLPKSQGPEALETLPQKRKKP
ncbi:hypothetical protein Tco_1105374 [Tanacetum coccineum]